MNVNLKKVLFMVVTAILICAGLVLTGCGGGGGSGSTLSPEELEVATVLDAFAAAVNEENRSQAMSYIFSGLTYYGDPTTDPQGSVQFDNRLQNFFAQASSINCQFTSPGISITSETTATVRALLIVDYSIGGLPQTMPPENVELIFQKDSRWGIVQFARYDKSAGTSVTAFPPQ